MQVKQPKSMGMGAIGAAAGGAGVDLLSMLGMGQQTSPKEYIEIIESRAVLQPIINQLDDLTDEEKKEMTVDKFSKKYLDMNNPKGTNIIELTVTAKTPQQAQFIASEISKNLKNQLTAMGQQDNSYMKNFIENQLKQAQADMEAREKELLAYSQKNKVFSPDDQATAMVNAYAEIEKKKAESVVGGDIAKVKLAEVNRQLAKENKAFTEFNMTDNPSIEAIRGHIIAKEMEILTLKQTYQEKHPSVILAREQLEALKAKLVDEVAKAVKSQTMTLNPVQGELIKQKALTEASVVGYEASVAALNQIQGNLDNEILKFSGNTATFLSLKRQQIISQEIYLALRKQAEQYKIQEAKDSMDIAIIDEADVPYKPSFPKKSLFLAAGLILGFFWASGKVLYLAYQKEELAIRGTSVSA